MSAKAVKAVKAVKATKAKGTGNNSGLKMINTIKTELKQPKTNVTKSIKSVESSKSSKSTKSIKSTKSAKSTDKKKNTVTLIRTGRTEKKRNVIKISQNDFVNNRYDLDSQAYIEYYPNFITAKKQKELLVELTGSDSLVFDANMKSTVPWQHGHYSMYGNDIPTPRLLYAMRDEDTDIKNSYKVTDSMIWTKEVKTIRDRIKQRTGRYCRYAQMNLYRNGDDYIGFHTDSEVGPNDLIASVSLGAKRTFRFISTGFKDNSEPLIEMTLEPGSLLIMSEHAAKLNWKHELPKNRGVNDMRINITFRPN